MLTDRNTADVWKKRHQLFVRLYRGREDRVGMRKEGTYVPLEGGLHFERFMEHMELTNTYALYLMDDEGRVSFSLFDLDVFPRKQEWDVLLEKFALEREKARKVMDTLSGIGITEENILVEFPTVGYHLVLFFSEPLSAAIVKKFMHMVLEKSGLSTTPFYPRNIEKGTYGDLVQIPFRMNQNSGRRSNLVRDLNAFDPASYNPEPDFLPLENVKPVKSSLIAQVVDNALG